MYELYAVNECVYYALQLHNTIHRLLLESDEDCCCQARIVSAWLVRGGEGGERKKGREENKKLINFLKIKVLVKF